MSRIDVTTDGKKFKVMLNFMQEGSSLSSRDLANQEAWNLKKKYPKAELHLMKD